MRITPPVDEGSPGHRTYRRIFVAAGILFLLISLAVVVVLLLRADREQAPRQPRDPAESKEPSGAPEPEEQSYLLRDEVPPQGPAGATCGADEALVVLANGFRSVHRAFAAGGEQPGVAFALREPAGRALLVVDLGGDQQPFARNLDAYRALGVRSPARAALVVSHGHTLSLGPPPGQPSKRRRAGDARPDGLSAVLRWLGPLPVQGPNLADLARLGQLPASWAALGVRGERLQDLAPGLRPLAWSDGTPSSRVWLLTYDSAPPERDVPFTPRETLVVVRTPAGYLVHAVCAHPAAGAEPPLHAAALVQRAMSDGRLPKAPVHTLVTGTCGLFAGWERLSARLHDPGRADDELVRRLAALRDGLGLRRLVLTHCALDVEPQHLFPLLRRVLEGGLTVGYPGSCVPLDPPAAP